MSPEKKFAVKKAARKKAKKMITQVKLGVRKKKKQISVVKKTVIPIFGGGLLSDSSEIQPNAKINISGVITRFLAWGYPCRREFHVIIPIFNKPKGKLIIEISIINKSNNEISPLSAVEIMADSIFGDITGRFPLRASFNQEGYYNLKFSFKDHKGVIKIPFLVQTEKWPEYTKIEYEFVKRNRGLIPAFRGNVFCEKCSEAYMFEEMVIELPLKNINVKRFPDSGIYKCDNCSHEMYLKDIQGQIRASLKEHIQRIMGKK